MKRTSASRETNFRTWTIGRFCSWLCGLNNNGFTALGEPLSEVLPGGISIREATGEQLGEALKSTIVACRQKTDSHVKLVFSQLAGYEAAKAEVVIRAVLPVIPSDGIARFVRIAARARPSLALTVARTAAAIAPEESKRIAAALDSVVAGEAIHLFSETSSSIH